MTRQKLLNAIGKLKPSIYHDKLENNKTLNHMSYFIIPLPHKVYESKDALKFFDKVKQKGWDILNKEEDRLFGTFDIKKFIYDNVIPKMDNKNKKNFLKNKKNIILQKKLNSDLLFVYEIKDGKKILKKKMEIKIKEIDLWIMRENIAFFVLKIELPIKNLYTVDEISAILNRGFRDVKSLFIKDNIISNKNVENSKELIDWLLDLTGNKSFLNVEKKDLDNDLFYPIYNSSKYAKFITAIHVDTDKVKINEKEYEIEKIFEGEELKTIEIEGTDVLEEMSYLLATTSNIYPSKSFEANENYINKMVNEGGINIWKYWSGLAAKDSLAFFSIKSGGSGIVNQARNIIYFIYMVDLYSYITIRFLQHTIIDEEFIDLRNIHQKYLDMQRLKNQFFSEEIAIRFQPNEIHEAILKAMKIKENFNEVKENISKTYNITKNNIGIFFSLVVLVIFIFKDHIVEFYDKHQFLSVVLVFIIFIVLFFLNKLLNEFEFLRKIKKKIGVWINEMLFWLPFIKR